MRFVYTRMRCQNYIMISPNYPKPQNRQTNPLSPPSLHAIPLPFPFPPGRSWGRNFSAHITGSVTFGIYFHLGICSLLTNTCRSLTVSSLSHRSFSMTFELRPKQPTLYLPSQLPSYLVTWLPNLSTYTSPSTSSSCLPSGNLTLI